jgi:hypothetical protein
LWNTRSIKVINSWGFKLGIGITILSLKLEDPLNIVNIYDPCQNRGPYWDKIFSKSFLKYQQVILGGDLKFSLGFSEVWGTHVRVDPLTNFFSQKMVECNLLDIEPIKLKSTRRNNIVGDASVAKRLDRFLIKDTLLEKPLQLKQWIGYGGISDHCPNFLEIRKGSNNPPIPFKCNRTWLTNDSFTKLVRENWSPFSQEINFSVATHFVKNLQTIKGETKIWAYQKQLSEDLEIKNMENQINLLSEEEGGGFSPLQAKTNLLRMEERSNRLIKEKEEMWRLKSRAIWMKSGDENNFFFKIMQNI